MVWSPLSARILVLGFIRAESAVIGRRRGCIGMVMSIMTTLFCGAVSLTQMYLSDSMVTCVKVMNCGLIPTLANCKNDERIGESENDERIGESENDERMGNAARHCGENDERLAKYGPLRSRAWRWGRSRPC